MTAVRASAELLAEGIDLHHPHLLAILVPEKRQGAGLHRLRDTHHLRVDVRVGADPLVHQPFHLLKL